ncbi:MAG: hypothetical protein WBO10_16370 [Pyrinomonadaceae bacterium]
MKRIALLSIVLSLLAVALSCSNTPSNASDSPTEVYKKLFTAVKAKDIDSIKKLVTKRSIDLAATAAKRFGSTTEKMLENGQTATTFSESLPEMRDERIKDNMAALEVWNSQEEQWNDLPFMLEDGTWKLAMGEQFAGTYQLPSIGRDQKEKEAANAANPIQVRPLIDANGDSMSNANSVRVLPPANSNKVK